MFKEGSDKSFARLDLDLNVSTPVSINLVLRKDGEVVRNISASVGMVA